METVLSEIGVVEINTIYTTSFFILIVTGSFSAILFSWHACFMFLEIKLEKKLKANLLAPILIFLPDLFTKKGNYHRIKFLRYYPLNNMLQIYLCILFTDKRIVAFQARLKNDIVGNKILHCGKLMDMFNKFYKEHGQNEPRCELSCNWNTNNCQKWGLSWKKIIP
jgi:hypothetical protein